MPLLLYGEDTEDLLTWKDAIDVTRQVLLDWRDRPDINPPRQRVHVGPARASVHAGGAPSEGVMGTAMHGEQIDMHADRQDAHSYPHVCALYSLTGRELLALLMGPEPHAGGNSTLSRLRTASISALGTLQLARRDSRRLALFGSGYQAGAHLEALLAVLPMEDVRVYSPTAEHRLEFVTKRQGTLGGVHLTAVSSPEEAVDGADIILCATNTNHPVFDGAVLRPGVHITSIAASNIGLVRSGTLGHMRRELDEVTFQRAQRVGILSRQQAVQDEQVEIVDPSDRGALARDLTFVTLPDLMAGSALGRQSEDEITIFLNNAGTGCVDIALAGRVYHEAVRRGRGKHLPVAEIAY